MTKYPQLQQILEKMNQSGHDYKSPVIIQKGQKFVDNGYWRTLNNYSKRQSGHDFTFVEHVQGFVYAALSCNRPWSAIEKHLPEIDVIFYHYDPKVLKQVNSNELINELKNIGCGNRQINQQMQNLSKNIETLERIAQKHESIDNYFAQFDKSHYFDLVLSLSEKGQEFKLENMGVKLICEYLKNMGIDIVKPDGQVNRLLCRIGLIPFAPDSNDSNKKFRAVIDTCHEIALEYDLHDFDVDCILWQYCAKDYMEICNDKPKCNECLVVDCKYRKNCYGISQDVKNTQSVQNDKSAPVSDGEGNIDDGIGEGHIYLHEIPGYSSFGMSLNDCREIVIKDRIFTITYGHILTARNTQTKIISDDNYAELIAMMRRYKNLLNRDTTPAYERFPTGCPTMYNYDFEGRSNHSDAGGLFVGKDDSLVAEANAAYEIAIQKIINQ